MKGRRSPKSRRVHIKANVQLQLSVLLTTNRVCVTSNGMFDTKSRTHLVSSHHSKQRTDTNVSKIHKETVVRSVRRQNQFLRTGEKSSVFELLTCLHVEDHSQ